MKRFIPAALATLVIGAGLAASLDRSRANLLLTPTSGGGGGGGIAFVSSADLGNVLSGNLTANCTVGSGANRLLLVFGAGSSTGADTVTGITYNGVAMTRVAVQTSGGSGAGAARTAYLYYLLAPASGTHSVVVSQTGGDALLFGCADYTGVNQSAQPDSFAKVASGSPTTSTLATTLVAANSWVVTVGTGLNAVPTVTGGTNTRRSFDGSFVTWVFGDSNAAESAGSYSMTVNWPSVGSLNISQITASFSPAGGGGGGGCDVTFTSIGGGQCRRFLTSGTSWTVVSNWTSVNTIEAIGGGGGGGGGSGMPAAGGGGGGEYRKLTNVSAASLGGIGAAVPYTIGTGGAGAFSNAQAGDGVNTTFNTSTLIAVAGKAPDGSSLTAVGGVGGTGGTGGTGNAGGTGGAGGSGAYAGGAGAGGPGGVGGTGGAGASSGFPNAGSGGGGANGGGGNGVAGTSTVAGNGGASITTGNQVGQAGGAAATAGTNAVAGTQGSGGGGAIGTNNTIAGAGGPGTEWDGSHGSGGGGGGGAANNILGSVGGAGGLYGGGGGAPGFSATVGGAGAQGIIVLTYTP